MSRDLKGWVRPRPIRVAFLVQDGEHAQLTLDGIFADCYYRWGGRFSLIVPCQDGRIMEAYWPWLESYDADIIYSYVPLESGAVLEIHERLSPSLYKFHSLGREPRLDVHGFKPAYDFEPLSSMSAIFRLARFRPFTSGAPIKIIDSWYTERPSMFLTDNFGTYHVSQGGSMYPSDATVAATLLTIISPEHQSGRHFSAPKDREVIPDEAAAFRQFAEGTATSLSFASTIFAPKLDIRNGRWSSSFNLVIGDNFADRIMFWNGRLFIPGWLDTYLCCARVTLNDLRNDVFLETLGELIKRQNHVNGGSGGQSQLTIRSVSMTAADLEEAEALLKTTKPWGAITTEVVTSLCTFVPTSETLVHARESKGYSGEIRSQTDWKTFNWSPPKASPPLSVPDHLAEAPSRQLFARGYWAADFTLEYDGLSGGWTPINHWELPRRWRMASSFEVKFVNDHPARLPHARRSRGGNLGIFVSAGNPVDFISVPSAFAAIQYALALEGRWAKHATEHGEALPKNKVIWARPSNEARYLTGILGMTGGFARARNAFLHPFLQKMFAKLGGAPNVRTDKVSPTATRLRKKVRRNPNFNLKDEHDIAALAELIVKAGRELKNPVHFLKYEDLKADWKTYRDEYWIQNKKPQPSSPDAEWDKLEEASLDEALIEMRGRQMLFQGHRWTCRGCHHRNWVDLAALSSELPCEVCKRIEPTPVDIRWLFRPNEFLIESLRDHSVLSLIWVLAALSNRARRSFIFIEPTSFGFTEDETNASAEIDLMAIVDGVTILCEVKSSWRFRPVELTEFVDLAVRLRPEVALLGVMEVGPRPTALLETARANLQAQGIKFEVLSPSEFRLADDAFLHLN